MRCSTARKVLETSENRELAEPLRLHIAQCPSCRTAARNLGKLRAGFYALAKEEAPELSLGFRERLLRRLNEPAWPSNTASDFFETVGRRFVLGSLVLAMLLLMALVLPSSGPLRAPTTAETYLAQPEPNQPDEATLFAEENLYNADRNPVKPAQEVEQRKK